MLISEEYRAQQAALHAGGNYGFAARTEGARVRRIVEECGVQTLLDYGCGRYCHLRDALEAPPRLAVVYRGYDPAVEEFAAAPSPAEMVACVDVLEHIEPECLESVLHHLAQLTERVFYATIHTGAAVKTLADGRNAHLIQQPLRWWLEKFAARFYGERLEQRGPERFAVVAWPYPREGQTEAPARTHAE